MKGIVFTEFLEMVEDRFSLETAEKIIDESELASGGAYTSIGTYDAREMGALLGALSKESGVPAPALLHSFGVHLFARFYALYPVFFEDRHNALDFLESLEEVIHTEVQKLYPDAELPRFDIRRESPDRLEMVYRSSRALSDLAAGLIAGCITHFDEQVEVSREDLSGGRGVEVRFRLERRRADAPS
ncbi:MAG: heme NO-binding domain-containing protein [Sandaracinaceae bacterium]